MDELDLFDVKRKKKRAPKPKSPHAKAIQHLMLRVYLPLYAKAHGGEKPDIAPRDWGLLRLLVDTHGPDLVETRLRDFFNTDDRWVREQAGFSMGVFKSQWQKLAAKAAANNNLTTTQTLGGMAQERCQHSPRCLDATVHSRRLVADMKGQYQSRDEKPTSQTDSSPTTSPPNDPF